MQVKGDRFHARARTATPEEKPELWRTMAGHWPAYDDYQRRTEREIPVVVLERASSRTRDPLALGGIAASRAPRFRPASSPTLEPHGEEWYPCSRRMRARPLMRGRSG